MLDRHMPSELELDVDNIFFNLNLRYIHVKKKKYFFNVNVTAICHNFMLNNSSLSYFCFSSPNFTVTYGSTLG